MKLSLIITTYNRKTALKQVLISAFKQTVLPSEIIIADDGSNDGTDQLIWRMAKRAPVPLFHSWQENRGFRAAESRNRAIARAKGDYIVLIDGDMILEKHFIEDHQNASIPNYFIQGGRVILGKMLTKKFLTQEKSEISIWNTGISNRKNCIRSSILSFLFSKKVTSSNGIRTCNLSLWKKNAIDVNGFNNDIVGWGREDSEFCHRMMNNGVHRINLKFKATAYHLFHNQQSRDPLPHNDEILRTTIANNLTWCQNGIDTFLKQ